MHRNNEKFNVALPRIKEKSSKKNGFNFILIYLQFHILNGHQLKRLK